MTNASREAAVDARPSPDPAEPAGPAELPPRGIPVPWRRLGRCLHAVSHAKFIFWALGIFFQFKTMFLSPGRSALLDNLNLTLLMYGIAMSFEGLCDNAAIPEKRRRECLAHQKMWRWMIAGVFAGGLFSMAVGCAVFFLTDNRELGWAITTFGLGMICLGRQRYDQFTSILSAAPVPAAGSSPSAPPC